MVFFLKIFKNYGDQKNPGVYHFLEINFIKILDFSIILKTWMILLYNLHKLRFLKNKFLLILF